MSYFSGVHHYQDQREPRETLARVSPFVDEGDSADAASWLQPGIGLSQRLCRWLPEQRNQAPVVTTTLTDGSVLTLVGDLRIDNRQSLLKALRRFKTLEETCSDAELVLHGWAEHGDEVLHMLRGDFAFAVWEGARKRLTLARDPLGIKPLFIHRGKDSLIFSNEMACLVGGGAVETNLSRSALEGWLLQADVFGLKTTLFDQIERLEPGTQLSVQDGEVTQARFWNPEDVEPVAFKSIDDMAEAVSEHLQTVVQVRLRTTGRLGIHLSGGMDSAAIARACRGLMASEDQALSGYCWLPSENDAAAQESQEWRYAQRVAEEEHVALRPVQQSAAQILDLLRSTDIARHNAVYPLYEADVLRQMQASGETVLLSGWGGDEFVSNTGLDWFVSAARRFQWLALKRQLNALNEVEARGQRSTKNLLKLAVLQPLAELFGLAPSINEATQRKAMLAELKSLVHGATFERLEARSIPSSSCWSVREKMLKQLQKGHLQSRAESWASMGRRHGVEYRYPLLDQDLVTFALGLPGSAFYRDGRTRRLLRDYLDREGSASTELAKIAEPVRVGRSVRQMLNALVTLSADSKSLQLDDSLVDIDQLRRRIDVLHERTKKTMTRQDLIAFRAMFNAWNVARAGSSLTRNA